MTVDGERPEERDSQEISGPPVTFSTALQDAMKRRGASLRAVRQRLADRGHDISVSTLSLWQSGGRRPERGSSLDAIRDLEDILYLDDGALTDLLGPSRRVSSSRHVPFHVQIELPPSELIVETEAELFERSGAVGLWLDAEGKCTRTVNRTLWQARIDGAREATVLYGIDESDLGPIGISGTMGCDLIDRVVDEAQGIIRATLRLHSPLHQGELALTERETIEPPKSWSDSEMTIVAPRREAEFLLYVVFDRERLPRRCRVLIEADGELRTHSVPLNGDCISHAEFNFGPGMITLQWDW